ncbi:MAG: glycosyltransferase family 1 protein [Candidatus Magasanikbacteria bacterium]|nr:glycosyltransferase family 1 protein [Candidatus Magasanikbacteria bacterium]
MKIAIDARMYGPKQGGLGRYIEQLILNLEKIDTENQYTILLRQSNWNEYSPSNPNFQKVLADIPWYGWKEQILLPKIIKKLKVDLVHFPHWNVPLFFNKNFIVTIHDLLLLHYPSRRASTLSPIFYWIKNKIFLAVLNHAAKQSKKIITISEFTKKDIIQTLKIKSEKISVTLLSPFEIKLFSNIDLNKKYNITKPYWLYVGVAYPHKNLETLLSAWEIFCQKYNNNFQLVLAGNKNYFYERLEKLIKEKNIQNVILVGFVPDDELPNLYKNATLYIFPSLYEGFGLPPLEAMQYHIPVISSNTTCLPEILAIIKKYSWNSTVSQTLSIYKNCR